MVVQIQASRFGELAQKFIDGNYRAPFHMHVLNTDSGNPGHITVLITWGPGGGS
jgi:hypothetical protein